MATKEKTNILQTSLVVKNTKQSNLAVPLLSKDETSIDTFKNKRPSILQQLKILFSNFKAYFNFAF